MAKSLTRIELLRRSPVDPEVLQPVGVVEIPTCGHVRIILNHTSIGEIKVESSEVTRNDGFEDARNELETSLCRLNSAIQDLQVASSHTMTDMYQFHKWTVVE